MPRGALGEQPNRRENRKRGSDEKRKQGLDRYQRGAKSRFGVLHGCHDPSSSYKGLKFLQDFKERSGAALRKDFDFGELRCSRSARRKADLAGKGRRSTGCSRCGARR
jgi:hypothetical protein